MFLKNCLQAASGAVYDSGKVMPAYSDRIMRHADMWNLPPLGKAGYGLFGTVQVNLADPVYAEDQGDLSKDMGEHFGKKHHDIGDSVGHWTTLISNSDCPPEYDPGCFYFPIAQVFVVNTLYTTARFCGCFAHTGGPIIAPAGYRGQLHGRRHAIVVYPPHIAMEGNGCYPVANLYNGTRLTLGPEMRNPELVFPY